MSSEPRHYTVFTNQRLSDNFLSESNSMSNLKQLSNIVFVFNFQLVTTSGSQFKIKFLFFKSQDQNKAKGLKVAKEELRLIGLMVVESLDRIGLMVNRHDGQQAYWSMGSMVDRLDGQQARWSIGSMVDRLDGRQGQF